MPRKRQPPPYLKHRGPDGKIRARTVYTNARGQRVSQSLGKWGSAKSYAKHAQIVARWRAEQEAAPGKPKARLPADVETIRDLTCWWLDYATKEHYPPTSQEPRNHGLAIAPLLELFADEPCWGFDADQLGVVQQRMMALGWSRDVLCRAIVRLRTMFRHAERFKLVQPGTFNHLRTLARPPLHKLPAKEALLLYPRTLLNLPS